MRLLTRLFGTPEKEIKELATESDKKKDPAKPESAGTTLRPPVDAARITRKKPAPELTALELADKQDWQVKTLPIWKPGDVILDTYEVEGIISGGMGHVYIAHHNNWNVKLAIKSPNEMMLSDRELFARILREADSWTELGLHPNIAYCYYVRNIEDVPHIVVEYVDGGNLRQWIEEGKCIDYRVNMDLAIQFCHGMEHAHSKGLIHRDIKPENVLMTKDGILKITDFGLVRGNGAGDIQSSYEQDVSNEPAGHGLTTIGTLMGTEGYMAPEQAESAGDVDERADIFSFGVCLYEMFCGNRPYDITYGPGQEAPNPNELSRDENFPDDIGTVLTRCVQWEPENRYLNFKEIRHELSKIYKHLFDENSRYAELELLDLEADGLNNRGVSFFELSRQPEAATAWQEALKSDPTHLESNYNFALTQWRDAAITDDEAMRRLAGCASNPTVVSERLHEFLAYMHVEGLDREAARAILEEYPGKYETLFKGPETGNIKCLHTMKMSVSTPGHTGKISSVGLTEDGRLALSSSEDKTLRLWDLENGSSLGTLKGHSDTVNSIALIKGGLLALSAGSDKTLCLWDLQSRQCVRVLEGHTKIVSAVAVAADGRLALSASTDKTLRLWDFESGKCLHSLEVDSENVNSIVLGGDGRLALSAGGDEIIRLWKLETGQCLRLFEGHGSVVNSLAISKDGRLALSGSSDKTLRLWDTDTGHCLRTLRGHVHAVHSVSMDASGRLALSGGDDDTIRLWDLTTGRCLRTLVGHNGAVDSVCLTADCRFAVSGGKDKSVRAWELSPIGNYEASLQFSNARGYAETKAVHDLLGQILLQVKDLSEKGKNQEAFSLLYDSWREIGFREDARIEKAYRNFMREGRIKDFAFYDQRVVTEDQAGVIYAIDATDDGRLAISGGEDMKVHLWDIETGRCLRSMEGHTAPIYGVCTTPEGRLAVSGGEDKIIRLWELDTGRCLHAMEGHTGIIYSVSMTADGRLALSGGVDQKLHLWEVDSGRLLRTMEGHTNTIYSVSLTADGRFAVSGGQADGIRIWELESGRCLRTIEVPGGSIDSLSLSADGGFAAAGGRGSIMFWDLSTGSCLQTMKSNGLMGNSVAITADGRFAISVESENLSLWDLGTGQCLNHLKGHTNPVNAVYMNSDGMYALSGGVDKSIRFWRLVWNLNL